MKLRGLYIIAATAVLAALLGVGSTYLKNQNPELKEDIKSQLTEDIDTQKKPSGLKAIIAKNLQKKEEEAEKISAGETILVKKRQYTEAEIAEMTEEEFIELVKETESKLPTLADIKKLPPEALHRTPPQVMQAGRDLGLLSEVLKVHESYDRSVVAFYDKCARSNERPTSVRALCLTSLITIKKKNGEGLNLKTYPAELVELSRMITDI